MIGALKLGSTMEVLWNFFVHTLVLWFSAMVLNGTSVPDFLLLISRSQNVYRCSLLYFLPTRASPSYQKQQIMSSNVWGLNDLNKHPSIKNILCFCKFDFVSLQ